MSYPYQKQDWVATKAKKKKEKKSMLWRLTKWNSKVKGYNN